MIEKTKVLARNKFPHPLTVDPGDQFHLTWKREFFDENGDVILDHPLARKETLVYHDFDVTRTFDEGVIIDCEFEGREAVGGLLLEQHK